MTQNNRAFEFLGLALEALGKRRVNCEQVAVYIRLAIPEIQEAMGYTDARAWPSAAPLYQVEGQAQPALPGGTQC